MSETNWIQIAVIVVFGALQYWIGYVHGRQGCRSKDDELENINAYRKQLREAKSNSWDEGRNAEPVHGGDHDVYCSEYECLCDVYVNPYRDVKRANSLDGTGRTTVGIEKEETE